MNAAVVALATAFANIVLPVQVVIIIIDERNSEMETYASTLSKLCDVLVNDDVVGSSTDDVTVCSLKIGKSIVGAGPRLQHELTVLRQSVFLSMFKWEERKNWKCLLRAYFEEFDPARDNVLLVLKTSEFHNNRPVKDDVDDFQKKHQRTLKDDLFSSAHRRL